MTKLEYRTYYPDCNLIVCQFAPRSCAYLISENIIRNPKNSVGNSCSGASLSLSLSPLSLYLFN